MATARRLTSQSGPFRIHRRHLYYPCTLCTLWLSLLIITIHLPRTLAQIEDIILDLEDPDDYVDEVVANLEREQADRERHQVEAAARCRVRCLAERQVSDVILYFMIQQVQVAAWPAIWSIGLMYPRMHLLVALNPRT